MDERSLLQLLAEEAPPESLRAVLPEAEAAGASPSQLNELREAVLTALHVRVVLRERQQRELELAALFDTAGDLIGIRDVDLVLKAIVRRARQLLAAETAYITIVDHGTSMVHMRVTDGMVTEEFKHLEVPLKVGLGGLVAQTGTPYFTPDYANDPRFLHTRQVDRVVGTENLSAILGVPMTLDGQVVGVLFASNRQSRPFTPNEVNLLGSLAAHAVVALDNARLFQRTTDAVTKLQAANEAIRSQSRAVELAAAMHERLTDVVLRGGTLDEVAVAIVATIGGSAWVQDPEGRLLTSVESDDVAMNRQQLEALIRLGRDSDRPVHDDESDSWITPIVAGSRRLGTLVLTGQRDLGPGEMRTQERAAQVIALVLLNQRALVEARLRTQADFVNQLVSSTGASEQGLRRQARIVGLDLDDEVLVVVASTEHVEPGRFLATLSNVVGDHDGIVGNHGGKAVVLLPHADIHVAETLMGETIPAMVGAAVTSGVAGPQQGIVGVRQAHQEADRCHCTLLALGRAGEVATVDDLGVYALLLGDTPRPGLEQFVERSLGPVLQWDMRRDTELEATMLAYYDQDGNAAKTAERLHIHINTLYQRFDRIATLLGGDWQEPERRLHLHLACRLRLLQGSL